MDNNNILNNIKKIVDEKQILQKIINEKNELIRQKDELIRQKDDQLREKDDQLREKDDHKIIEHKMKVHLRHTQDWSYGIRYNILQNKSQSREGSGSPGVIDGLFPKEKIPCIKKISIINIKNTLTRMIGICIPHGEKPFPGGNSRSANVDINGNLWTETPYGHRYGSFVTWDSYIDIVILLNN